MLDLVPALSVVIGDAMDTCCALVLLSIPWRPLQSRSHFYLILQMRKQRFRSSYSEAHLEAEAEGAQV